MHAYRDPRTALVDKKALLESELATLDRDIAHASTAIARAGGALLDRVQIASHCDARWEDMFGDDTRRACGQCNKDVYNLSEMTRAEAEAFLESRLGLDTCLQFFRRRDGTIITKDCKPSKKRVYLIFAGVGTVLVLTAATTLNNTANSASERNTGVMAPIGAEAGTTTAAQSPYSTGK